MGLRRRAPQKPPDAQGLSARLFAVRALQSVFFNSRPLGEALETAGQGLKLDPRDAGFARLLVMTVLRRLGQIDATLAQFLCEPLPVRAGPAEIILRVVCAELHFLNVAPHAAVSLAVAVASGDKRAVHFKGLINAVGRRLAAEGKAVAEALDVAQVNTPEWAWAAWSDAYGEETARAIATAHLAEPALDLSVRGDAAGWAAKVGGTVLPTGTVRRAVGGRIEDLPGYAEGAWWVQDAASAMPALLLGEVAGKSVIDLCAAPGGKTAQLAARGADVIAVDHAAERVERLRENLKRLGLKARAVVADVGEWKPDALADAVLLDAPCTATGTARRHPDVLWRKDVSDVLAQSDIQTRLLEAAAAMVKPGGTLVYCVCSMMPQEGEAIVEPFLAAHPDFERVPVRAAELGGEAQFVTAAGDLRTLPSHWPERGGLDGFYAARLRRRG